jgi:hypothetical protein
LVLVVGNGLVLSDDIRNTIAMWMPGKEMDTERKKLFLQCGGNLTALIRTCKTRGYA